MFFSMGWGMSQNFSAYMGGETQNFSNSQSLYRGEKTSTTMSLRVECSRLVETYALSRLTAVSLQEEFGAYMEETKK